MVLMYKKKKPIRELKEGELVKDDVFVVKIKKSLRDYSKGLMFNLVLSDNSGKSLDFAFFGGEDEEGTKKLFDSIKEDDVILITEGKVNKFKGKLSLVVDAASKVRVLEISEYDTRDFVRLSDKNIDEMFDELMEFILFIQNEEIKAVVMAFFGDEEFVKKFKEHPGAIEIHHNWSGGLLEHTLEVVKYCLLSVQLFPALNKDLLIAGAVLHDIGKLREMEVTTRIKGSREGQLLGHISIGVTMLSGKFDELNTDMFLREKLMHIMLSHHGKLEYGSPKEPMFPEAMVVYYADEMSSKIAEILDFMDESKEETEDEFKPKYKRKNRPTNILLK